MQTPVKLFILLLVLGTITAAPNFRGADVTRAIAGLRKG